MGERRREALRVDLDRSVKIEFRGAQVTSDAGLLAFAKLFRGDAGFASSEIYELLETEGFGYSIRLKSNPILEQRIAHLLARPRRQRQATPDVRFHLPGLQLEQAAVRGGQGDLVRRPALSG